MVEWIVVYPHDSVDVKIEGHCCPAPEEYSILHIASLEKTKTQNSKELLLLNTYLFHSMVKSKNQKSSHC